MNEEPNFDKLREALSKIRSWCDHKPYNISSNPAIIEHMVCDCGKINTLRIVDENYRKQLLEDMSFLHNGINNGTITEIYGIKMFTPDKEIGTHISKTYGNEFK